MQALLGTRTAADVNMIAQLLLLAGLLAGFWLARRRRFEAHANVQTAMVLVNLVFIAVVMATSFYDYVIAGGTTTGSVAQLMVAHAGLGVVVEGVALYLILRMRTELIPPRLRVRNIKVVMRTTLALWTVLVGLGVAIYAQRYLIDEPDAVAAPLVELRQLGADLYVHAVELEDAAAGGRAVAVGRHAEHLINLIEGNQSRYYGDNDADGRLEDPGDGTGLLARLDAVATVAPEPDIVAKADEVRGQLREIVALSLGLLGADDAAAVASPIAEIVGLAQAANGDGVYEIDQDARAAGVVPAPEVVVAAPAAGTATGGATVTVREDRFQFIPDALTVPAGTTVVWVNDEAAKHTATADDGAFASGDQNLGDEFAHTFDEPGAYPYYCRYHGDVDGLGMAGVVVVE